MNNKVVCTRIMKIQRPLATNSIQHPGYLIYDKTREYETVLPYHLGIEQDIFPNGESKVYYLADIVDKPSHFTIALKRKVPDQSW